MTINEWLYELKRYIVSDLDNIDDSIIIELRMLELHLDFNQSLPNSEQLLERLANIVEFYTTAINEGHISIFPSGTSK